MIINIRTSHNKYNNIRMMTKLFTWAYEYSMNDATSMSQIVAIELKVKTDIYRQLVYWRVYKWL